MNLQIQIDSKVLLHLFIDLEQEMSFNFNIHLSPTCHLRLTIRFQWMATAPGGNPSALESKAPLTRAGRWGQSLPRPNVASTNNTAPRSAANRTKMNPQQQTVLSCFIIWKKTPDLRRRVKSDAQQANLHKRKSREAEDLEDRKHRPNDQEYIRTQPNMKMLCEWPFSFSDCTAWGSLQRDFFGQSQMTASSNFTAPPGKEMWMILQIHKLYKPIWAGNFILSILSESFP